MGGWYRRSSLSSGLSIKYVALGGVHVSQACRIKLFTFQKAMKLLKLSRCPLTEHLVCFNLSLLLTANSDKCFEPTVSLFWENTTDGYQGEIQLIWKRLRLENCYHPFNQAESRRTLVVVQWINWIIIAHFPFKAHSYIHSMHFTWEYCTFQCTSTFTSAPIWGSCTPLSDSFGYKLLFRLQ